MLCEHAAWAGYAAGCARLVGVGAVGCCVGMLHGLGMQLGVQGRWVCELLGVMGMGD